MPFHPNVGDILTIGGVVYRMTEHPAAPGIPYGQEGRQAVVYRVTDDRQAQRALKVFKPRYRMPALVSLAERITPFATLPGLQACQRIVITPQQNGDLLRQQPDLIYAVLMPWVTGPTWMEVMLEQRVLTPKQSLALARSLAEILAVLEQRGIAHCDLSGPNVLLPGLVAAPDQNENAVALVDVEQLHASNLDRPVVLPGGSPGYAHKTAPDGLWLPDVDRFAGAVLIAEMLGWSDDRVREAAWGEGYFDPQEMQQDTDRFRRLSGMLAERYGQGIADLFARSWRSETLADCPTFGEWLVSLPATSSETQAISEHLATDDNTSLLLTRARRKENTGDLAGTIIDYQAALQAANSTALRAEIAQMLALLQNQQAAQKRLDEQVDQARAYEQAARWREAAAVYQKLLHEEQDPAQRRAWQSALVGCRDEIRLTELGELACIAMAESRWSAAFELLDDIVRKQPAYRIGSNSARALRDNAQRQLAKSQRLAHSPWRWLGPTLLGGLLLIAIGTAFGVSIFQDRQASSQRQVALAATIPWLTVTAQAQATTSALATELAATTIQAQQTRLAIADEGATSTIQAQMATTDLSVEHTTAIIAQVQSTPTSAPSSTATRMPKPTSTPMLPTATPSPRFTTNQTVNVRAGPGTNYGIIGQLSAGQAYDITGRNLEGGWWQFAYGSQQAWVNADLVDTSGDLSRMQVASSIPTPPAAPALRKIAFLDDDSALWLMNTDGSGARRLISLGNGREITHPRWFPNGRKLVFSDGSDVYVVNADGSGLTRVLAGFEGPPPPGRSDISKLMYSYYQPAVSPDGTKLVAVVQITYPYSSGGSSFFNDDLIIASIDGRDSVSLAESGNAYFGPAFSPIWSPDGTQIAVASLARILIMRSDGSDRRELVAGNGGLSWSPDGTRIAFQDSSSGRTSVYVIGVDGNGLTRLAAGLDIMGAQAPSWSPDGRSIALADVQRNILIVNADGSGSARKIGKGRDPTWQP